MKRSSGLQAWLLLLTCSIQLFQQSYGDVHQRNFEQTVIFGNSPLSPNRLNLDTDVAGEISSTATPETVDKPSDLLERILDQDLETDRPHVKREEAEDNLFSQANVLDAARDHIKQIETEKNDLRNQVSRLSDQMEELGLARDHIKQIETEKNDLRNQVSHLSDQMEELGLARDHIKQIETEKNDLRNQVSHLSDQMEEFEAARDHIEQIETEKSDLLNQVRELQDFSEELEIIRDDAESRGILLTQDISRLRQQNDEREKSAADEESSHLHLVGELKQSIATLMQSVSNVESEKITLEESLDRSNTMVQEMMNRPEPPQPSNWWPVACSLLAIVAIIAILVIRADGAVASSLKEATNATIKKNSDDLKRVQTVLEDQILKLAGETSGYATSDKKEVKGDKLKSRDNESVSIIDIQHDHIKELLEKTEALLEQLKKEKENAVNRGARLESAIARDKAFSDTLMTEKAAAESRVSTLQTQLAKDKASAKKQSLTAKAAAESRVSQLEAQLAKDKANDAAVMTAKAAAESRVSELEAQLAKDKANDAAVMTAKAAAESRVSQLEAQLAKDKANDAAVMTAKAAAESRVSELEAQLAKGNDNDAALTTAKNAASTQYDIIKKYADQVTRTKAAAESRVSQLEAQLAKGNDNDAAVMTAKAAAESRVSQLEAQLAKDKANDAAVMTAKAAAESRVSQLEAQLAKGNDNDAAVMTAKAAAESRVSELEAQLAKDKAKDVAVMTAKAAAESRVSELEAQLVKDKASSAASVAAKSGSFAQYESIKKYADQLTRTKAAADNRVSELEGKLQLLLTERDTALNAAKGLGKEHEDLKSRFKALESDLTQKVINISAKNDRSEKEKAAAESRVLELEAQVVKGKCDDDKLVYEDPACVYDSVTVSEDDEADDSTWKAAVSPISRGVGSDTDDVPTFQFGDEDDDSSDIECYYDRIMDKKFIYKKFVGRIFECINGGRPLTASQKAQHVFHTFMVSSIEEVPGKKQLYFFFYDVVAFPKGPPPKKDTSAWTLCPCRHLISQSHKYRFK